MLTPEKMQRTLIVSSKSFQPAVIEALHDLQAAHFIDFQERRDGEFADFRIGTPLPQGAPASERLVRIRALLRNLGLEGAEPARTVAVRDLEGRLDATLEAIERDAQRAVETRESLRAALAEGRETEAKLEPLVSIPLRLEDFRGYETLQPFVGRADPGFEEEAHRASPDALLVRGEGQLFALFAPKAQASAVADALYKNGFAEIEIPEGAGTPDERIRAIQTERSTLEARLVRADQDLHRLAAEHRDFLLAAEEHLAIAVEKAEAPLAFASTDHAFVVDAWVPLSGVDAVERTIQRATKDNVYFARLETADHHGHAHADGHGHHDGVDAMSDHHAPEPAEAQPPTKYANPAGVRRFQWFVDLFSTPRYGEVDPTLLFSIFFPLFFGFMIGDLGLGLLMVGLGFLMIRKLAKVDGMKQLGTAILIAGIVAAVLGGFVFKDALGIPLGFNHHMEDELAEHGIALGCNAAVYEALHETTWGCLLGGQVWHAEPLVYKVSDIPTMLLISVAAAFVHLLLGLLIGVRNELGHGAKHVGAKVGYLVLLFTFFPAVIALLRPDVIEGMGYTTGTAFGTAGVGFLLGGAILGWAEGIAGIVEIPGMFTAIMSYLRLGAVAIAKGAMAVAFNNLTLVSIGLTSGGVLMLVVGIIAFLIAQAVLFVLGLLSGGIQALRLNFVEFFTKFYKGGGVPYAPFGRARRVTTNPPSPSTP